MLSDTVTNISINILTYKHTRRATIGPREIKRQKNGTFPTSVYTWFGTWRENYLQVCAILLCFVFQMIASAERLSQMERKAGSAETTWRAVFPESQTAADKRGERNWKVISQAWPPEFGFSFSCGPDTAVHLRVVVFVASRKTRTPKAIIFREFCLFSAMGMWGHYLVHLGSFFRVTTKSLWCLWIIC